MENLVSLIRVCVCVCVIKETEQCLLMNKKIEFFIWKMTWLMLSGRKISDIGDLDVSG